MWLTSTTLIIFDHVDRVAVNCTAPTLSADMPYGGTKQSGMGRELGPHALDSWVESKAVFVKIAKKAPA